MKIPTTFEIEHNLRQALIVKSEELFLTAGGQLGSKLVELLIGTDTDGELPTDFFCDEETVGKIDLSNLSIKQRSGALCALLSARTLGDDTRGEYLDSDTVEQQYLDYIELFLATLPNVALGGFDWTSCRVGPIRALLETGTAWHHLTVAIDDGTLGDFTMDRLTARELALIAGIDTASIRNFIGPNKILRSTEFEQKPKSRLGARGYAAINRFDALAWLCDRKAFRIAPMKPGFWSTRLHDIDDGLIRGRSASIAWHAMGNSRSNLALALDLTESDLRNVGDGIADLSIAKRVADYVAKFDLERASFTVPTKTLVG